MPSWGRTAPANRHCPMSSPASPATRSPAARSCSRARTCWRCRRTQRAAKGVFLAFQYPVEIPGVATMTFLRTALNAQRKARGESEYSTPDFLKKVREVAKSPQYSAGHAATWRQCRLLRRREEAQRGAADGFVRAEPVHPRRDGFRLGHRRAAGCRRRRQRAALAGAGDDRDHPLSAAPELHRARRGARDVEGPGREDRRPRSWRWSWKPPAMRNSRTRLDERWR